MKILVSACMLGFNTRYDAKNKRNETLIEYLRENRIEFYPLCAEQLGGLSTPREPSEIERGYTAKDVLDGKAKVLAKSGEDLTEEFLNGAYLVLDFCKEFNITHAILQDRSPSCGFSEVYDGAFDGELIEGKGVLAQLLEDNGIEIIDDLC